MSALRNSLLASEFDANRTFIHVFANPTLIARYGLMKLFYGTNSNQEIFMHRKNACSIADVAKRFGSGWQSIVVLLVVFLPLLSNCAHLEPGRLPAADIRKAMAGNTIVHTSDRTGFKWYFDQNWKTLFDPDHGFPVRGQWHIWRAGNRLCNWDVDPDNAGCAAVYLEDGRISLDYGKGLETYSLVQGNATDPSDNPGLNFDPSRELAVYELQDVAIQPPAESLATELAGFSGAWYGTWYSFRDFAIIVEKIDQQTASLIYAIGPNKWTDSGGARSRKVSGRIKGKTLTFDFWKGFIVCTLLADGKLDVVYRDEGWVGRSVATRWNNPPWASSIPVKLETPDYATSRTKLPLSILLDPGEPGDNPIHNSYFSALGPSVGPAHDALQGRIEIGASRVVGRPAGNRGFRDYPDLPVVSLDFFTVDDELVPRERHKLITRGSSTSWDLIVEPGRIWSEAGDEGWSRAAFPFALIDKGDALLRNGLATFVYNANEMSPIRFQIIKESSPQVHLDLWGSAQASYTPESPPGLQALIDSYAREKSPSGSTFARGASWRPFMAKNCSINLTAIAYAGISLAAASLLMARSMPPIAVRATVRIPIVVICATRFFRPPSRLQAGLPPCAWQRNMARKLCNTKSAITSI